MHAHRDTLVTQVNRWRKGRIGERSGMIWRQKVEEGGGQTKTDPLQRENGEKKCFVKG